MKRFITLLLCFAMVMTSIATVNAASDISGAKKYTLGTAKSGSYDEKSEAHIYKFSLANAGKIDINLYADLPYMYVELFDSEGQRLWDSSIYDNDTTKEIRYLKDMYLHASK